MEPQRPWELISLELDEYAARIGEFFEKELRMPIRRVKSEHFGEFLRDYRYYRQEEKICEIVNEALGQGDERKLVVYGHGDFHQFTYGLCRHADRLSQDYAYIHFDHHHDSWGRSMTCGEFVPCIMDDTHASSVFFIGSGLPSSRNVSHKISFSMTEKDLRKERGFFLKKGGFRKLESGLKSLPEQVYMTFDLDVMDRPLILTGYDQGTLRLEELMKCIALIKQSKQIIGADVLGYAGEFDQDPGREVYAEIVKSLMQA